MKAKVFFADLRTTPERNMAQKIRALLENTGITTAVRKADLTAVKVHFGEAGNTAFIRPVLIRPVIDSITDRGALPFLTDTNTLYTGERGEAVSHVTVALVHGFNYTGMAAPVIIADGLRGTDEIPVPIRGSHFTQALIGSSIVLADALVCISHFKGHELSGFGGALKNLGMGCASRQGKMKQHTDVSPTVMRKSCVGCGRCQSACQVEAIQLSKKKARINHRLCIGCAKCITVCPEHAIEINWGADTAVFQEKMIEYALGALHNKKGRAVFLNFLTSISPQCDCYGYADQPIVGDIGILASTDPVAIDQASVDLVNSRQGSIHSALPKNHPPGRDKFRALYPSVDWKIQLDYAQQMGLGKKDYRLVKV